MNVSHDCTSLGCMANVVHGQCRDMDLLNAYVAIKWIRLRRRIVGLTNSPGSCQSLSYVRTCKAVVRSDFV